MSSWKSLRATGGGVAVVVLASLLGTAPALAADASAPVIIDEVYGGGGNAGATLQHDFIELYNPSASAVDLSTWSVQYASVTGTTWQRTNLVGSIPAGGSYVVRQAAGNNAAATPVVGDAIGSIPMSGTTGKVALVSNQTSLPTCGATVGSCSSLAEVVDFVGYGGASDYLGAGPAPTLSNTTSASRNAAHTNTASNVADFTAGTPTPCGLSCGTPPPPPPPTTRTIAEIQGTGSASPLVGTTVTTTGVVTASYPAGGFRGFYIQTPGTGGALDLTTHTASDGLFVFLPTGTPPAIGDYVTVTGPVSEFNGLTEITAAAADVVPAGAAPAPVTAATTATWPATDAERESLEGMLYRPTGEYTVTNTFTTNQFGEVGLASGTTPLIQPTESARPGTPEYAAVDADNKARAVTLDDAATTNFLATNSAGQLINGALTPPYLSQTQPVRSGAPVTFTADVVVDFRNGLWKFQPTSTVVGPANASSPVTFGNTRTATPDTAALGAADVTVASFNVLNFFTTLGADNPSCLPFLDRDGSGNNVRTGCDLRGAWDPADLERQRTKIVKAINALDADVVGLMEIENSARLGEPVDEALLSLVAALNADAGGDVWAANPSSADLGAAADEDFITNAIIYRTAAVERVGDARALSRETPEGSAFANAREPIAQVFAPVGGGSPFLFVVNHFKSKGSAGPLPGDADAGDGQGASNASRVAQATQLRDWIPGVLAATGTKAAVLAGDFNAYTREDPMQVLYDAGYTDSQAAFPGVEYSYSFSGLSGSLDHILLNGAALGRATGSDIWDINADESVALEYSRWNYTATDFLQLDPYRSSDHDPVLVGLRAAAPAVPVQILATNDFHGRIQANGTEAGAAVLAGAVKQLRAAQPNTVFAAAGDLIGASTFESFIAQDKPTIDALNEAGLEVSAVGNHELDQGYDDLINRIMAEYDPVTNPNGGARWEYLAANLRLTATGDPAVPATWVKTFGDVEVGFIGAVTEDLPELVSPAGIAELTVDPIVESVNREAAVLEADGVDVVVLLVHEGSPTTNCADVTGDNNFGRIVTGLEPTVDAVISGHTHLAYNCLVPVTEWEQEGRAVTTRPVVSAGQYGTNLNQILITVDPDSGEVLTQTSAILPLVTPPTTPNYPADPATKAIVDAAVAQAAVLGAQPLGTITAPFNRAKLANGTTENRGGESTLGNLVAEVQRWATEGEITGSAQIAFMNPGGLRADLVGNSANGYPATVTYRQAANVQPFANTLVNMRLTGAQIRAALEQQWQPAGAARPFLRLGISAGFTYTYDPAAPAGSRITAMELDGQPVTDDAVYSVTVNSFLASGGDNFTAFAGGTQKRDTGKIDLQAMVDYLADRGTISPDYTQRSVGVQFPADAPETYTPGQRVAFSLSSLAFSTAPDVKDASVTVSLDGTTVLATVPVDNTVGTAVFDEIGTAAVEVVLPADTAAGSHELVITGTTTGTTARVAISVEKAATTTTVTTSPSPSVYGAPVTATATVAGPVSGGTVQFSVDGVNVGAPVAVTGGTASRTLTGLSAGGHTVTATFSGDAATTGSSGTATQVVQYAVRIVSPAPGSTVRALSLQTVAFQLTDFRGAPIRDIEAARVFANCSATVSGSGAQAFGPYCPVYNPITDRFVTVWLVTRARGAVTLRVAVSYPGAPTQTVDAAVTVR